MLTAVWALLTLMVGVAGVGAYHSWLNSPTRVARRALQAVRPTTIREASPGATVKIIGRARKAEKSLRAPITKRLCYAWHLVVEEATAEDGWAKVLEEERACDFMIDDATGKAMIMSGQPKLALHGESCDPWPAPTELLEFCESRNVATTGLLGFRRRLRYREGLVEDGETVAAMGIARWEFDPSIPAADGYRGSAKRLVIVAPEGWAVIVSNMSDTIG